MGSFRAQVEARTRDAHQLLCNAAARPEGWTLWQNALLRAHAPFLVGAETPESTALTTQLDALAQGLSPPPTLRADMLIWAYERWQHAGPLDARTSMEDSTTSTQLFTDADLAEALFSPCLTSLRDASNETLRQTRILDPCSGASSILLTAFRALVPLLRARFAWTTEDSVRHLLTHTLRGIERDPVCASVGATVLALEAYHLLQGNASPENHDAWMRCTALPSPIASTAPCAECTHGGVSAHPTPPPSKAEYRRIFGSLYDEEGHQDEALAALLQAHSDATTDAKPASYTHACASFKAPHAAPLCTPHSGEVAGRWLRERIDHLCTNVPFLARGKQPSLLRDFCEKFYPDARHDLANVFLARCMELAEPWQSEVHLLMPQNWLFLRSYIAQRKTLLRDATWRRLRYLPEGAFQSADAAGAFVILLHLRAKPPAPNHRVQLERSAHAGFHAHHHETQKALPQSAFLEHPSARIVWNPPTSEHPPLSEFADAYVGLQTGDDPRYIEAFWAFETPDSAVWQPLQSTPTDFQPEDGNSWLIRWDQGEGPLHSARGARPDQGHHAWGKTGIAIQRMRRIFAYEYAGTRFHQNIAVIVPKDPEDLPAIRAFCYAPAFEDAVRQIDQKLNVTNRTLTDVAFDKAHWTRVAQQHVQDAAQTVDTKADHPHPYRQRSFTADTPHPHPLHLHLARYLGARWPTEASAPPNTPWYLLLHPAPSARKAHTFAGWLDAVHHDAATSPASLRAALDAQDQDALLAWLRDDFFVEHCRLFLDRPFIWHIWDGTPAGFSILVRYHRLTHGNLQQIIDEVDAWLAYLRQDSDAAYRTRQIDAATVLRARLRAILDGVPPYDLYIRWKPPTAQPTRWTLDLNDGVHPHLRPFLTGPSLSRKDHGILRHRPRVHFRPDRGHDPSDGPWAAHNIAEGLHAGARVNDRHGPFNKKSRN